MSRSRLDLDPL